MPDLDAIETEFHERLEPVAASLRTWMSPDGDRTRGMRELDRFTNLETLFRNEPGSSCTQITIECLARITHVSAANQSARNVRTPYGSARCLFHHSIQLDVDSKSAKSFDDALRSHFTRIPKCRELRLEHVAPRNVQREQMNFARPIVRAQLGAGDDSDSKRLRCELRFTESAERIVISKRDRGEPGLSRRIDYGRWCKRAIGRGRVHMQVDLSGRPVGLPRGRHRL